MRPVFALLRSATLVGLAAAASPALAQPAPLTIEQITQRPETWIGAWPSQPFWTDAGDAVYFEWNPRGEMPADSLWRVDPAGGTPERVPADERRLLAPRFDGWTADGSYSPDRQRRAFERDGDVWVYDVASGDTERVTRTTARESSPDVLARREPGLPPGRRPVQGGRARRGATDRPARRRRAAREGAVSARGLPPRPAAAPARRDPRARPPRLAGGGRARARPGRPRRAAHVLHRHAVGRVAGGRPQRPVRHVHADHRRRARADVAGRLRDRDGRGERDPLPAQGRRAAHRRRVLRPGSKARHDLRRRPFNAARRPGPRRLRPGAGRDRRLGPPVHPRRPVLEPGRTLGRARRPHGRQQGPLDRAPGPRRGAPSPAWTASADEAWLAGPGIAWWGGASEVGWLPDGRFWFHSEKTGWSQLYAVDRDGHRRAADLGRVRGRDGHAGWRRPWRGLP